VSSPKTPAKYTTVALVAAHMGVCARTVHLWIEVGILRASQPQVAHYTDTRPRSTYRALWRIHEDDLADFLGRMRGSRRIPPGLLRGG